LIKTFARTSRSLRLGIAVSILAGVATAVVCWTQVARSRDQALDDLHRRAAAWARVHSPAASGALTSPGEEQRLPLQLDGHSRLLGMTVLDAGGTVVAAGRSVPEIDVSIAAIAQSAIAEGDDVSEMLRTPSGSIHVLAHPLIDAQARTVGTLLVFHDALYIEDRVTRGLLNGLFWTLGVTAAIFLLTSGAAWALFERPLNTLAEWMRRLRFGGDATSPPKGLPVPRLADESARLAISLRTARNQEWDQAQEIVKSERAWTRERLRAHAIDSLGGSQLVVVSNREPYMHELKDGKPRLVMPASGLVTGLDPVLRACGGLWVAHGAGSADRQTANASGCIAVPPADPRYTLRRVWISKEEEQGYYYGFSNEGLWPLCHLTHERPIFRAEDWEHYKRANKRFADAVLEEIGPESAVVMVQDYQLALVPGMIKAERPDLRVGLFWHIPWPNAEAFRICPYRVEILKGMLGADLVGFHLQQHCNNFLESVDRMVEARLDWDRFSVHIKERTASVKPFPISVQPWSERGVPSGDALRQQTADLRARYGIEGIRLAVGVDRIDYTKGIAERLRAIDRFFEANPQQKRKVSFVQLGAPSRTHIPRYRELVSELEAMADKINWRHTQGDDQTGEWKPVHFLVGHHDGDTVHAFLRMADVCLVSSLHDGMNLVAKEFVSAKQENGENDGEAAPGVLILSEFAGAARDLPDALVINPYDTEQFAAAIRRAFDMDPAEARTRMARMRMRVESHNIYRWAADFLAALAQVKHPAPAGA